MDASNSLNYSYLRHSLSLLISQQEASIKRLQNNDSLEKHKMIFPNDFSSVQQYDRVPQTANKQSVKISIRKAGVSQINAKVRTFNPCFQHLFEKIDLNWVLFSSYCFSCMFFVRNSQIVIRS